MAVYTNKSIVDTLGNEIALKKLKLDFNGSTLSVFHIMENEDKTETETLVLVQPWKCHDDGSRSDFINEQDAYNWFETVKHILG